MIVYFVAWIQSRSGATAIEYALMAGGIGLAALGAVFFMGDSIEGVLTRLSSAMNDVEGQVDT